MILKSNGNYATFRYSTFDKISQILMASLEGIGEEHHREIETFVLALQNCDTIKAQPEIGPDNTILRALKEKLG